MTEPRRARLIAAVVAVALAVSLSPSTPVRAASDDPHQIPGVAAEPGPISGTLGGSVYDLVYRIEVPSRYVLMVSMTGDRGTDFDLYVFNSSATTIYGTQGLVTSSTGNTSDESASVASSTGGTYYVDFAGGASPVAGNFFATIQLTPDTVPPSVALALDGGAASTNNPTVTATIMATDNLSGVDVMSLSSDGVTWGPWQTYSPTILWTFPAGDGPKTLWVRVQDRASNDSSPAKASIMLDTTPPQIVTQTPDAGSTVADLRFVVSLTFSEPANALGRGTILVQDAASGVSVAGVTTVSSSGTSAEFRPSGDLRAGSTYLVTPLGFEDVAGNTLSGAPSWTIRVVFPSRLALSASVPAVAVGASVSLAGTARLLPAEGFVLERALAATGPWEPVRASFAEPGGKVALTDVPPSNAWYRLHHVASDQSAEATSNVVRVSVSRLVALAGPGPATTRSARRGSPVLVTARVLPVVPSAHVSFQLFRWDPSTRRYRQVTSAGRWTGASGQALWQWRTGVAGRWAVRVVSLASDQFVSSTSPMYVWTIR